MNKEYQDGLNQINHTMKYDGMERIDLLSKIVNKIVENQPKRTVIRVAGTNGKGSTAQLINNILLSANKSVGLFTSPYILDPLEQIHLQGHQITSDQFLSAEKAVRTKVSQLGIDFENDISEFETWFLIAVQSFIMAKVDFMILECGMGGELDATNAIDHSDYSIFTLIGLDHFKFLGDTLEQIATTKARMIREGEQVISYPNQPPVVAKIIDQVANARHASVNVANDIKTFDVIMSSPTDFMALLLVYHDYVLPLTTNLHGRAQSENIKLAIKWWEVYERDHPDSIDRGQLSKGIEVTKKLGCFSTLSNGWIVDGAHNRDAIRAFVDTVNELGTQQVKLIMVGFLADKEVEQCVHELQGIKHAIFLTVTPDNPDRSLPAEELYKLFQNEPEVKFGTNSVFNVETIAEAAKTFDEIDPKSEDLKLVVGSFYTVRGVMEVINGKEA